MNKLNAKTRTIDWGCDKAVLCVKPSVCLLIGNDLVTIHVLMVHVLLQIKPLVAPTKAIMEVRITNFQWHEFFPRGNTHGYVACS